MTDPPPAPSHASRFSLRGVFAAEWPYLLILVLVVIGVAWTSFAQRPMTVYWLVLAPLIGLVCVVTRWRATQGRERRMRMIWTQALHWGAIVVAMNLVFAADVDQMMNTDARALFVLTLLALGTFTAGIHAMSWQICLVGVILAAVVPAVAWLEQTALLISLAAVVAVGIAAPVLWRIFRRVDEAL